MLPYFFTPQEAIPPGLGFSLWGPSHLCWLAAIGGGIAILCAVYRRLPPEKRRRMALGLCVAMLLLDLAWDLSLLATGRFTLNYLPLDLCGLAMFGELWSVLRPGTILDELCYCLFLPGALMALVFPNWTPLPFWNLLYLRSFLLHGLLAAVPILPIAGGEFRPDPRNLPKCFAVSLALCVPIYGVDKALDQNFFFLNTPSPGSPLVLFQQWLGSPGYLVGLPVMLGLVWIVLYGPPVLWRRRKHRA